jgi:hypothetical protein
MGFSEVRDVEGDEVGFLQERVQIADPFRNCRNKDIVGHQRIAGLYGIPIPTPAHMGQAPGDPSQATNPRTLPLSSHVLYPSF